MRNLDLTGFAAGVHCRIRRRLLVKSPANGNGKFDCHLERRSLQRAKKSSLKSVLRNKLHVCVAGVFHLG